MHALLNRLSAPRLSRETLARLEQRVVAFERAMQCGRAPDWTDRDMELIFAHYLLGLVFAVRGRAPSGAQMALFRRLAALVLPRAAIARVVHLAPPANGSAIARVVAAAEEAGRHDGGRIARGHAGQIELEPISSSNAKPRESGCGYRIADHESRAGAC
ncbi:hypothetical protein [Xanthobacter sp. KR7-225]|uniref:hypothetical protein n=1 Tax=Xanthobacter sp. KR7-225 TaxID=3156613 RepID=UPI0032B3B570